MSTQDDLFARDKKKPTNIIEIIKEQNESFQRADLGYIEIEIESTNGQLSTPKVLNFRNFNLDEVIELNSFTDKSLTVKTLIKILTQMNSENYDCSNLHSEELKEIMLKLFATFQDSKMRNMAYLINEDDEVEAKNIEKVDIDLTKLKINSLSLKATDSLEFELNGNVAEFEFPKMKHIFLANDFIEEMFKEQIEFFKEIEKITKEKITLDKELVSLNERLIESESEKEKHKDEPLRVNSSNIKCDMIKSKIEDYTLEIKEKISIIESSDYDKFLETRNIEYAKVFQKLLLKKYNNKELELTERLDIKIDSNFYKLLNSVVKDNSFGVSSNYKFRCKHNKKSISRRFPFRTLEFIPTLQLDNLPQHNFRFN